MPSRRIGLACLAVATVALTACGQATPSRPTSAAGSPHPSASHRASPSPTPTHPVPASTTTHPAPKPTGAKPKSTSTAATGTVSAASLGISGAGTLELPAWPAQKGMRYNGPHGSMGSTGTPSVALTFDDGPGPYTDQILDILDKYHVKATFCLIGRQVHTYAAQVKREIADGMTICDHTWDHNESLGKHNGPYIASDINKVSVAVHKVVPTATVDYFRNPGGNFTTGTVRVASLLGMRSLYWNVDTKDWTRPGVAAIENSLVRSTHRDSIVLMHDGGGDRSESVAALRAILPRFVKEFSLIPLPTTRAVHVNPGPPPVPPSPSAPPSKGDAPVSDVPLMRIMQV